MFIVDVLEESRIARAGFRVHHARAEKLDRHRDSIESCGVLAERIGSPDHCLVSQETTSSERGRSSMPTAKTKPEKTKPDPFDEGCRAAAEGIPAEANPYPQGSDKHALWQDGHEVGAQALE